jgi:AcrR family transcriptional regulator
MRRRWRIRRHPNDTPPAKIDGRSRPHDIERTRAEILQAALTVFAEKGLTGARVDDIAALTHTAKPIIYYHFGSKEELHVAVLENAYGGIRNMERTLELDLSKPDDAMRRLIEASFDYHAMHPDWVRLISIENIHCARHYNLTVSKAARKSILSMGYGKAQ